MVLFAPQGEMADLIANPLLKNALKLPSLKRLTLPWKMISHREEVILRSGKIRIFLFNCPCFFFSLVYPGRMLGGLLPEA